MDKNKRNQIALAVLIVMAIWVWSGALKPSEKKGSEGGGGEDIPSSDEAGRHFTMEVSQLTRAIARTAQRTKRPDFGWGRDPFVLPAINQLEGIIWDETSPQALINTMILGVGDRFANYTVIEIRRKEVILNDGIQDVILRMDYSP